MLETLSLKTMNTLSCGKCMTVLFIIICGISLRYYGTLQALYPDLKPLQGFAQRFTVVTLVLVPMMKLMWFCMVTAMLGGYSLYICYGSKMEDLFPMGYLIGVLPTIYTTTPWLFLLGLEQLVYMELFMIGSACFFLFGFVSVLKCRAEHGHKSNLGKLLLWYDLTVVEGLTICTNWYWHCIVSFGTISIAYKDGPGSEAMLRGYCDPTESCGYFLLPVYVIFVLGWIFSDYVWWPQITNRVKLMYPAICYVCIGVLINTPSFQKTGGLSEIVTGPGLLVHKTYVVLTLVSFTAWMFRGLMCNTPDVKKEQ